MFASSQKHDGETSIVQRPARGWHTWHVSKNSPDKQTYCMQHQSQAPAEVATDYMSSCHSRQISFIAHPLTVGSTRPMQLLGTLLTVCQVCRPGSHLLILCKPSFPHSSTSDHTRWPHAPTHHHGRSRAACGTRAHQSCPASTIHPGIKGHSC